MQLTINEKAWQSLDNDLRFLIRTASEATNHDMLAEYNARSGPALRTLVQKHGVKVKALPEEILLECGKAANEVLNEVYESGSPIVRKIVLDFLKFRQEVIPWTRISEQAYLNARRLPFEFKLNI